MSNHLQRLATQATRRVAAVHPIVGSMYAPVSAATAREEGLIEVIAEEQSPREFVARETQQREASAQRREPGIRPARAAPIQRETPERPAQGAPVRPNEAIPALRGTDPADSGDPDRADRQAEAQPINVYRPRIVFDSEPVADPWLPKLQEIAGESALNARSVEAAIERRPAMRAPLQPSLMQPPPRTSAGGPVGSRGSEEIQIHIGRVEVIAVPPTPPRPLPQRRTESLDEYLRRHDRRSR